MQTRSSWSLHWGELPANYINAWAESLVLALPPWKWWWTCWHSPASGNLGRTFGWQVDLGPLLTQIQNHFRAFSVTSATEHRLETTRKGTLKWIPKQLVTIQICIYILWCIMMYPVPNRDLYYKLHINPWKCSRSTHFPRTNCPSSYLLTWHLWH